MSDKLRSCSTPRSRRYLLLDAVAAVTAITPPALSLWQPPRVRPLPNAEPLQHRRRHDHSAGVLRDLRCAVIGINAMGQIGTRGISYSLFGAARRDGSSWFLADRSVPRDLRGRLRPSASRRGGHDHPKGGRHTRPQGGGASKHRFRSGGSSRIVPVRTLT